MKTFWRLAKKRRGFWYVFSFAAAIMVFSATLLLLGLWPFGAFVAIFLLGLLILNGSIFYLYSDLSDVLN